MDGVGAGVEAETKTINKVEECNSYGMPANLDRPKPKRDDDQKPIREVRCSGEKHHRIGDEWEVRIGGKRYRMLSIDGCSHWFPQVIDARCGDCGYRWDFHGGEVRGNKKNQTFE